jgi:hypothetical protein
MKKIPTIFVRDFAGNPSRVLNQINDGCEWVANGEGVATRKMDGTSCLIRDGKLYRRRELKNGEPQPPLFELADHDEETGKTVGWMPIEPSNPSDKYHAEALGEGVGLDDGTYELVGPKVQGNPEKYDLHTLVPHDWAGLIFDGDVPRTFDGLKDWLNGRDIEGLVFHHSDGRMAKIKLRDFGLKRGVKS